MEPIKTYLLRKLDESFGHHTEISRQTGVPQSNISRLYHNRDKADPRLSTVQPLLDYFKAQDADASNQRG
ncbi:MAG TPA: hypothetical protein VFV57_05805 [Limnobacter sp.]|nr:hypothetical protein [Limnobacter sp.]